MITQFCCVIADPEILFTQVIKILQILFLFLKILKRSVRQIIGKEQIIRIFVSFGKTPVKRIGKRTVQSVKTAEGCIHVVEHGRRASGSAAADIVLAEPAQGFYAFLIEIDNGKHARNGSFRGKLISVSFSLFIIENVSDCLIPLSAGSIISNCSSVGHQCTSFT